MMRTYMKLATGLLLVGLWGCSSGSSANTSQGRAIPAGYETLCNSEGMNCQTDSSPPNLVGTYNGTGTTTVTSNSNWRVGDTGTFTVVVATQNGNALTGTFEMAGYKLDVPNATIQGSASAFTIYGTDTAVENDADASIQANCSVEARGVLSGALSTADGATTIAGMMTLEFTANIRGSGCTQDQITSYPGTGATFKYTATRVP
jgi:hypothetical protein